MESAENILITTDLNEKSLRTNLKYTEFLTKKFSPSVKLIHVVEESGFFSKLFGDDNKEVVEKLRGKLHLIAKEIEENYGLKVEPIIKYGRVTSEIAEYAKEIDCDLIIAGTSNAGDSKQYMGANTHRLIRIAESPVLTLHNNIEPKDIKNILLPIELFVSSRQKVRNAVEWAKSFDSKITIIAAALDDDNGEQRKKIRLIANNTKRFIDRQEIDTRLVMLGGIKDRNSFANAVTAYANDEENGIDMIMIMGKDEKAEFFISSTSQRIIAASKVPVLSVPLRKSGMSFTPVF